MWNQFFCLVDGVCGNLDDTLSALKDELIVETEQAPIVGCDDYVQSGGQTTQIYGIDLYSSKGTI